MLGAARAAGACSWWTVPRETVVPFEGVEVVHIARRAPQHRVDA